MGFVFKVDSLGKVYPNGTIANDSISFTANSGEIIIVLGQNGAGKSTLMKLLSLSERPSSGIISFNDNFDIGSLKKETSYLPQEFEAIEDFTVDENIALGLEETKGMFFYDRKKTKEKIDSLACQYGINFDRNKSISELSPFERECLMILKILYANKSILIFDEPTTYFSEKEEEDFYGIVDSLREKGKLIFIISHKLKLLKDRSYRFFIMDKARLVYDSKRSKDRKVLEEYFLESFRYNINKNFLQEESFLKIDFKDKSLILKSSNPVYLKESKDGLSQKLVKSLLGLERGDFSFEIRGKKVRISSLLDSLKLGINYLPVDRLNEAGAKDLTLWENLVDFSFPNYKKEKYINLARFFIDKYKIEAKDPFMKLGQLSGGNAQKLLLARELERNFHILILDKSFRGMDKGALSIFSEQIKKQAQMGKLIIYMSPDMEEAKDFCNMGIEFVGEKIKTFILGEDRVEEGI